MKHTDTDERYTLDAPYSLDAFADTYAGSPEILSEVLRIFLDETPGRIASLREAIEQQNLADVVRLAHSFANTTGTLKASGALRAARAAESAARAGDVDAAQTATDGLFAELDRVIEVIREATQI